MALADCLITTITRIVRRTAVLLLPIPRVDLVVKLSDDGTMRHRIARVRLCMLYFL